MQGSNKIVGFVGHNQCDQIWQFIGLWPTLNAFGNT